MKGASSAVPHVCTGPGCSGPHGPTGETMAPLPPSPPTGATGATVRVTPTPITDSPTGPVGMTGSGVSADPDRWADDLFAWRRELFPMQREALAAWDERGRREYDVRKLRRALAEAEAAFAASEETAQAAQRRLDAHYEAGRERGFRQ